MLMKTMFLLHKHFKSVFLGMLLACILGYSSVSTSSTSPKAWLGISFEDVSLESIPPVYQFKGKVGSIQIRQVFKGTSASQAGLKEGDFLFSINGALIDGRKVLLDSMANRKIGDVVELQVGRDNKVLSQKMALSPRPEDMRSLTQMLVASEAPSLEGSFYQGTIKSLKEIQGKPVILDFWATWCGPCRMTMPKLKSLHEKYADKGLRIIGISSENLEELKSFQSNEKAPYALFNDVSGLTQRKYQAFAYPTLVFIDKKGIIQRIQSGAPSMELLDQWTKEIF